MRLGETCGRGYGVISEGGFHHLGVRVLNRTWDFLQQDVKVVRVFGALL
jgi:hypothetical protein